MKFEHLYIFPQDENAHLITYIQDNPPEMDNEPRRAILICPGGGYQWTSMIVPVFIIRFVMRLVFCFVATNLTADGGRTALQNGCNFSKRIAFR